MIYWIVDAKWFAQNYKNVNILGDYTQKYEGTFFIVKDCLKGALEELKCNEAQCAECFRFLRQREYIKMIDADSDFVDRGKFTTIIDQVYKKEFDWCACLEVAYCQSLKVKCEGIVSEDLEKFKKLGCDDIKIISVGSILASYIESSYSVNNNSESKDNEILPKTPDIIFEQSKDLTSNPESKDNEILPKTSDIICEQSEGGINNPESKDNEVLPETSDTICEQFKDPSNNPESNIKSTQRYFLDNWKIKGLLIGLGVFVLAFGLGLVHREGKNNAQQSESKNPQQPEPILSPSPSSKYPIIGEDGKLRYGDKEVDFICNKAKKEEHIQKGMYSFPSLSIVIKDPTNKKEEITLFSLNHDGQTKGYIKQANEKCDKIKLRWKEILNRKKGGVFRVISYNAYWWPDPSIQAVCIPNAINSEQCNQDDVLLYFQNDPNDPNKVPSIKNRLLCVEKQDCQKSEPLRLEPVDLL